MPRERITPIRPSDRLLRPEHVLEEKIKKLPDQVLESFNEMIAENYSNGQATVRQKDIVDLLIKKGLPRNDIFEKGWLDVEDIYRKAGWKVAYDRPIYYGGEDFEPYYTFSRKI